MYTVFTNNTKPAVKLPMYSNLINYSLLSEYYCPVPFRSFSIKYVSGGYERYVINQTKFKVESGEYILANNFSNGSVEIESKTPVTGICIDIAPGLMQDVMQTILHPDTTAPDFDNLNYFDSVDFFENKFHSSDTHLGKKLLNLDRLLSANPYETHLFDASFYYTIAEMIILDYQPVVKQLQHIPAVKSRTRKELFRKLRSGYDYLDKNFQREIDIPVVAARCGLSAYYFFRLFRAVYGQSPMQFVISKRLNYARNLLLQEHCSVTETAALSGFSDIFSFSKAFRKQFGCSPRSVRS